MASLFHSDSYRSWALFGGTAASASNSNGGSFLLPALVPLPQLDISLLLILCLLSLLYLLLLQPHHKQHRILRLTHSLLSLSLNHAAWYLRCLLLTSHPHPVWLMGLEVFEAPEAWEVSSERYRVIAGGNFGLPMSTVDFCSRILAKSGLGQRTAFPPGICENPPHIRLADARAEAEHVLFTILDNLFAANPSISPASIDVLICNCSLFCPTPSLTALLVHRYHLSPHIQTYQLGGMGCSAGVIALHLARDLLQVRRNVRCIVVSTENITQNIYLGAEQPMLVSNALFRCGGAALLLTNRWSDRWLTGGSTGGGCRFVLRWTSRTHMGWDDASYRCVYQMEDEYGHRGVRLGKDLMAVAARALRVHVASIAHRLLPWGEIVKYVAFFLLRLVALRLLSKPANRTTSTDDTHDGSAAGDEAMDAPLPRTRPSLSASLLSSLHYTPSFSSSTVHPCVHAGGSGVLVAIQAALRLTDADMAVSRAVLWRYGNVSSASVFYELHLVDASRRKRQSGTGMKGIGEGENVPEGGRLLRRGDCVWLLAFGSGFKVNSALFEAL